MCFVVFALEKDLRSLYLATVGGGEAAEAGAAFVVLRRRISALLLCLGARAGKISEDGLRRAPSGLFITKPDPSLACNMWLPCQCFLF